MNNVIKQKFRNGVIFEDSGKDYLQISVSSKEVPPIFVFDAFNILNKRIKKNKMDICIESVFKDCLDDGSLDNSCIIMAAKNKKDLEKAYHLFWESLLESNFSNSELRYEEIKMDKQMDTVSLIKKIKGV